MKPYCYLYCILLCTILNIQPHGRLLNSATAIGRVGTQFMLTVLEDRLMATHDATGRHLATLTRNTNVAITSNISAGTIILSTAADIGLDAFMQSTTFQSLLNRSGIPDLPVVKKALAWYDAAPDKTKIALCHGGRIARTLVLQYLLARALRIPGSYVGRGVAAAQGLAPTQQDQMLSQTPPAPLLPANPPTAKASSSATNLNSFVATNTEPRLAKPEKPTTPPPAPSDKDAAKKKRPLTLQDIVKLQKFKQLTQEEQETIFKNLDTKGINRTQLQQDLEKIPKVQHSAFEYLALSSNFMALDDCTKHAILSQLQEQNHDIQKLNEQLKNLCVLDYLLNTQHERLISTPRQSYGRNWKHANENDIGMHRSFQKQAENHQFFRNQGRGYNFSSPSYASFSPL